MLSITPHAHVEEFISISLDFQTVFFNPSVYLVCLNIDTTKCGLFTVSTVNVKNPSNPCPIGFGLTIIDRVTKKGLTRNTSADNSAHIFYVGSLPYMKFSQGLSAN